MIKSVLSVAIFLAVWLPAQAHSPEHFAQMGTENEEWMRGLKNDDGDVCCNGKDGYDAIYDTHEGHYRVLLFSKYWVVPDKAIIKEPNKMGVAQVWYSTIWSADKVPTPNIHCFIPGAGI